MLKVTKVQTARRILFFCFVLVVLLQSASAGRKGRGGGGRKGKKVSVPVPAPPPSPVKKAELIKLKITDSRIFIKTNVVSGAQLVKVKAKAVSDMATADPLRRSIATLTAAILVFFVIPLNEKIVNASISWLPFRPWQILNILAWALNMWAVSVPGRLDGSQAAALSDEGEIRFFTPAGWAFAIWGPIFLGEALFAFFQLLPIETVQTSFIPKLTVWWIPAVACQSLWCSAFRPWAKKSDFFWLPAALLTLTAVALGGAHKVLFDALHSEEVSMLEYIIVNIPLTLHFGWITAASLVNWNGYFASATSNILKKSLASSASIVAGVIAAALVGWNRIEPFYPLVVSWALAAVADKKGWSQLEGKVPGPILKRLSGLASLGSGISLLLAIVAFWHLFSG